MHTVVSIFFVVAVSMASAQRPFYAGLKPIGYPELADRFQPLDEETTTAASLGNRFGEDGQTTVRTTTSTVRLPVDALGDKNLIDRISKWPVDKQPYWYINWKIIEAHRQQRPNVQEPSPSGSQQQNFAQPQQSFGQPQQNFNQPQQPQGSAQRPTSNQRQFVRPWEDNRRNNWQNQPFIQDRFSENGYYWN